jgi:adenylate cyclase
VPIDEASRLWRALGFPVVGDDDRAFTEHDVLTLRQVQGLAEGGIADADTLASMTRMLGQSFSRLASWQGQLLIGIVAERPELAESEERIVEMVGGLLPVMAQIQDYVWRRQLAAYFSRVASPIAEEGSTAVEPSAVGFADMAGFTALTRRMSESQLRAVLDAFETVATEVVGAHHGRVVKTIGDEVLFVAGTAPDAAEIALGLLEAAAADELLPPLRVGLASGEVLSRLGDVFGATVNIASRLTALARPGTVLVDREMAEALRDDERYVLRPRRPESVRGYQHLRQWRLTRAGHATGQPPRQRLAEPADRVRATVEAFVDRTVGRR